MTNFDGEERRLDPDTSGKRRWVNTRQNYDIKLSNEEKNYIKSMFSVYSSSFGVFELWPSQFRVEFQVRSSCSFETLSSVFRADFWVFRLQYSFYNNRKLSVCLVCLFKFRVEFSMVIINFFNKRNLSVYLLFGVFVLCSELSFQCSKFTSSCILSTRNYLQSYKKIGRI